MLRFNHKVTKPSLLFAVVILSISSLLSACSSNEHDEVHAADKVEEASEMARANAPEAEVLDLEVTKPDPDATTDTAADTSMTGDVPVEGGTSETSSDSTDTSKAATMDADTDTSVN